MSDETGHTHDPPPEHGSGESSPGEVSPFHEHQVWDGLRDDRGDRFDPEPAPTPAPPQRVDREEPELHSLDELAHAHTSAPTAVVAHPLTEIPGDGVFGVGAHLHPRAQAAAAADDHVIAQPATPTLAGPSGSALYLLHAAGEPSAVEHRPPTGAPYEPLAGPLGGNALTSAIHDEPTSHEQAASVLWAAFASGASASGQDGRPMSAIDMLEQLATHVTEPLARDAINAALDDARAAAA